MGMNGDNDNQGKQIGLSVALNVMGRVELADYGFRSWMLQDADHPYEIVLNLFNDQRARFEKLAVGKNPNCRLIIKTYDRPAYFNISAANNLGIFNSSGKWILFANSDVVYPSRIGRRLLADLQRHDVSYLILSRGNLTEEQSRLSPPGEYRKPGEFDSMDEISLRSLWRADGLSAATSPLPSVDLIRTFSCWRMSI
jgi:hypothetical protein